MQFSEDDQSKKKAENAFPQIESEISNADTGVPGVIHSPPAFHADNEKWMRSIFDASRVGIVVEDDSSVVYANNACAQILGYDGAEELFGVAVSCILPPDEAARMTEYGRARLRGENPPADYEFKAKRKDGSLIEVEARVSTFINAGKTYITTALRDLSERRVEKELFQETEVKYRFLTQTMSNAVIVADDKENITSWNNGAQTIFGYSKNEMLNQSLKVLIPSAYREAYGEAVKKVNSIGEQNYAGITLQLCGLRKDGSEFPMEFSLTTWTTNGEKHYSSIIRDIGERRRAEETLEESERRYRMLSEGILHHVWTANTDGGIDYFNAVALEYFGCPANLLYNEGWHRLIHPLDLDLYLKRWTKSIETGENYEMEIRLKAANGNYYWHLCLATAGRDESGKIIKWFGTCTDINDCKMANATLGRRRRQLETALEAGSIATWTYEPLTNQVYADKNLAQLFSVAPEDAHGGQFETYLRAIQFEDRERVSEEITAALKGNDDNFESEYRIIQPDNSVRWVVARARIERDGTGSAIRMPGVIVDITERKLAEKSLTENAEGMRQSQKMEAIGTLAGGIAHDFNNLLTIILVNTQVGLQNTSPDHSLHKHLTEIQNAGNRAAALTRQLLAFSRRQHLEPRTINLNKIIGETVNLLKRIIGADVEISISYAPDLDAVFVDPAQIEQVVMNLAVNARDAMPHGGKLFIETSNIELDENYCRVNQDARPGRYAQIKVEDTGEGIDEETQKRIFEPFFSTKAVGRGTGLGLSIIYGIVQQHNGHINVYSKPGEGTGVKIFLPVVEREIRPPAETSFPSLFGGTETILLAEDEESLRNVAVDILESMGYTVLSAKNGEEAIAMFKANRERIDLLLFDVVMPRIGGSEALDRIRELGSDVPLIFMTGYNSETLKNRVSGYSRTTEEEDAAVIEKPYSIEDLGRKVREILDKNKFGE